MATFNQFVPIIQGVTVSNTLGSIYTPPTGVVRTRIDSIVFTNYSAGTADLTVEIIESGGSAGDAKKVIEARTLAVNESYTCPELIGQAIESGGSLQALSSVATAIGVTATGTEKTS